MEGRPCIPDQDLREEDKAIKHYPAQKGDSVGIRTQDPQIRNLLLYPAELRNQTNKRFDMKETLSAKAFAKLINLTLIVKRKDEYFIIISLN